MSCLAVFVVGSARAEPADSRIAEASAASGEAMPAPATAEASAAVVAGVSELAAPVRETATASPGPESSLPPPVDATPSAALEPPPRKGAALSRTPLASPAQPSPPESKLRRLARDWYGWQTLASDAASLGVVLTLRDPTATKIGVLSFLAVPPVIHVANRNYAQGLESLGLRMLAPAAGAALGLLVGSAACHGERSCLALPLLTGFGVGIAGATALDATVLAVKQPAHHVGVGLRWRPVLMAGKTDARIGVAGTF